MYNVRTVSQHLCTKQQFQCLGVVGGGGGVCVGGGVAGYLYVCGILAETECTCKYSFKCGRGEYVHLF